MKEIKSNFIKLIYIDPPFYSQTDYNDFKDKWINLKDYLNFMKIRLRGFYRILSEAKRWLPDMLLFDCQ